MTEYTSKWNLGVSSSLSGSLTGFDPGQNTGPCSDSPSEREGLQQEFFLVSFLQRYFSGCAEGVPIFLFSTKSMTFFPFVVFFSGIQHSDSVCLGFFVCLAEYIPLLL